MTPQEQVAYETALFNIEQAKKLAPYDLQQAQLAIEQARASIANTRSITSNRVSGGGGSNSGGSSDGITTNSTQIGKNYRDASAQFAAMSPREA
jgi:hypothetical protein